VDVPAGAVDGSITVLPRSGLQRAARRGLRCSSGGQDGASCVADADCPAGACVVVQGVCDGGEDNGLLCDCPGGTCGREPACSTDPQAGTCRGGTNDGPTSDPAIASRAGATCVDTHRVCAAGASKGMPCTRDGQCIAAACLASGRRCAGGDFDGVSCIDAGDCPRGTCVDPNAVPTPTASRSNDGCAVAPAARRGSAVALLVPLLMLGLRRRR
jgi:hypothetical protein